MDTPRAAAAAAASLQLSSCCYEHCVRSSAPDLAQSPGPPSAAALLLTLVCYAWLAPPAACPACFPPLRWFCHDLAPSSPPQLAEEGALDLSHVRHFVVDECDKCRESIDMRADVQVRLGRC